MSTIDRPIPTAVTTAPPGAPLDARPAPAAGMTETDLAEVLAAFNDVTSKLHSSHEALRAEVARLRRELEAANERLERSRRLAALGEMAAGIAHEIRNPLGSIRLYARMLEQDLADRPPERSIAEKIAGAVRGADAVVNDVLAFAREMTVRPQPVSASELLTAAVEECLADERVEGALQRRDAADVRIVRLDLGEDRARGEGGGVELECDVALVNRALVNVIRNALQAMASTPADPDRPASLTLDATVSGGGGRTGRAPPGGDAASPTDRFVAITVRDTGPGIAPDVLHRMFNPFFTTRATGTGLGLSIVHRIVDAHAGRISVRNAEPDVRDGKAGGAVVEILLPAPPRSTPVHPAPITSPEKAR